MKINNPTCDFQGILSEFGIDQFKMEISPVGSGHINHTYRLQLKGSNTPDFLLQRINDHVFKNIPLLMENIRVVTSHLHEKIGLIPDTDSKKEVLTLLPAKNGKYFFQDDLNNFWRLYLYIKDTKSYDLVSTNHQAYQGGKAFGKFQSLLIDLTIGSVKEIIPDFHDIAKRLDKLSDARLSNPKNRVKNCLPELEFIKKNASEMGKILMMKKDDKLPLRIIHNDTKFNNILLNKNDIAQCVIDLDTVMPGFVAYDFGDSIRTIINTATEDEENLSAINIKVDLFEAYTRGYMEETIWFLTPNEIESLIYGVLLLPYLQAVRFLTDFIEGDHYYKTSFKNHNLQRARAQLQLLKKIQERQLTLKEIIYQIASKSKVAHQLSLIMV